MKIDKKVIQALRVLKNSDLLVKFLNKRYAPGK